MADAVITVVDNRAVVTIQGDIGGEFLKQAVATQIATQDALAAAIASDGDAAVAGALAGQAAVEDEINGLAKIDGSNVDGANASAFRTSIEAIGLANSLTWNDTGTVFTAFDFAITNTGSQLTSNLLNFTVTGTNPSNFYVDRRANIYASGLSFRLGLASTPGSSGNIHVAGSDIIIRGDSFGGGHTVFDGRFARGTASSPLPAQAGDQLVAFAVRSWDGAEYITTGDITWGASQTHGVGQVGTDLTLWNVLDFTEDLFAAMRFTGLGVAEVFCPVANRTLVRAGVNFIGYLSSPTIDAGVATGGVRHFVATDPGRGAGSSITSTHTGFEVEDLSGDGNKIAFRSSLASDPTKWALFLGGGAQSYISGNVGIGKTDPSHPLDIIGDANVNGGYRVEGIQVISNQGAAVADATDAASVITQLNAALARLRAHGLIAT